MAMASSYGTTVNFQMNYDATNGRLFFVFLDGATGNEIGTITKCNVYVKL